MKLIPICEECLEAPGVNYWRRQFLCDACWQTLAFTVGLPARVGK